MVTPASRARLDHAAVTTIPHGQHTKAVLDPTVLAYGLVDRSGTG